MKTSIPISKVSFLRSGLLIILFQISAPIYRFLFKQHLNAWTITREELLNYPSESLGKELGLFLEKKNFQLSPKMESHDVAHVLFEYDTDVPSEICLQCFFVGAGKNSIYAFGTIIIGLIIMPEFWEDYARAFEHGIQSIDTSHWDFSHLLKENTADLRAQIFQTNSTKKLTI